MVPVSWFAACTETRIVSGRSAATTFSADTRPVNEQGTRVTAKPRVSSSQRHESSTGRFSTAVVTTCRPRAPYASATPLIARLSASVPPEVKTISRGSTRSRSATWARAASTAASASQPSRWLRLAGWPKRSDSQGRIASTTRGSAGVVARWSR